MKTILTALGFGILLLNCQVTAQEPSALDAIAKDRVDVAVERAIKYLLTRQNADGSISDRKNDIAMTSLAYGDGCNRQPADRSNSPRESYATGNRVRH